MGCFLLFLCDFFFDICTLLFDIVVSFINDDDDNGVDIGGVDDIGVVTCVRAKEESDTKVIFDVGVVIVVVGVVVVVDDDDVDIDVDVDIAASAD